MNKTSTTVFIGGVAALGLAGLMRSDDGDPLDPSSELKVMHPECIFFGADHDKFAAAKKSVRKNTGPGGQYSASALTEAVVAALPSVPGPPRTAAAADLAATSTNTIDQYLFQAMKDAGVTPAPATTDYEFIRRVTLDLIGRIPTPDQVTTFVADTTPNKRAAYIDSIMSTQQWTDKWTMYFGDFFQNNSQNSQIRRFPQGVRAFNDYIRGSLSANKPYDQLAREMIGAQGSDSYTQGELNWLVGGVVTGGPIQDIWDQQTANIAQTFLGIAHVNCLLCHNGRGHLDALNLWGSQTTRQQAWGLSSFLSHTDVPRTNTGVKNIFYWGLADNTRYRTDYPLNTTTGNRPARQPVSGNSANVAPVYFFTGQKPASGQNYRIALGQYVTSDFQFARAAVNYMWAYFFGVGIVDPPNQFDLARLDPNNPPVAPWPSDPTQPWPLQPSNPQLLKALAQDFINSKYDLKALMREIANSQAYQLSARYNGTWNPAWQNLFARKLVRRLWSEEIHDAITQSSGIPASYSDPVYGQATWAMQLQEPLNTPDGPRGAVNNFLNAFLRGNRDDETRNDDGSISQALDLMNDNFVMNRVQFSKATSNSLLTKVQKMSNSDAVTTLFLTVLSRVPTGDEMTAAANHLSNVTTRNQELEDLLWSLYNKVDFVFNY